MSRHTPVPPPPAAADDEVLSQLSPEELIARIRSLEAKNRKLLYENGNMMKDINHHLSAIQLLKQSNYQVIGDNGALRDMCCYLDDERSCARAVAREWQSFGTHMSRVMRHEVTGYSGKLTQLEQKQFELVRENCELKQLCLLLDNALTSTRETGDGSTGSSGTHEEHGNNNPLLALNVNVNNHNSNNNNGHQVAANGRLATVEHHQQQHSSAMAPSQQILEYIRSLENKVSLLEGQVKVSGGGGGGDLNRSNSGNTLDSCEYGLDVSGPSTAAVNEAMRRLRIQNSVVSMGGGQMTENLNAVVHHSGPGKLI